MSETENTDNISDKKEPPKTVVERKKTFCEVMETEIASLRKYRKNPLMVMYYPDNLGRIVDDDIETLYEQFRLRGYSRDNRKIEELDIILHTLGGHPDSAYMMAQVLRSFANKVNFLIPYHAASAGSLLSFCGDKILFGAYAYLTPIDVSVQDKELGSVSVMSIDYFMNFATDCRKKMEAKIKANGFDGDSNVESKLLVELVDQINAITVGSLYRMRSLTQHYAWLLLTDYMFKNKGNAPDLASEVSQKAVFDFPAHQFYMDFNICQKIDLVAEELSEEESETTKDIIRLLNRATVNELICRLIGEDYRIPFIRLYVQ